MTARAKVLARTGKADRERLVGLSPKELAKNVAGLGESMDREAERVEKARRVTPDGYGASKVYEARLLADHRARLLAVCDEMRARIDLLLAGGEVKP